MKMCQNCGYQMNADDQNVCSGCGAYIGQDNSQNQNGYAQPQQGYAQPQQNVQQSNSSLFGKMESEQPQQNVQQNQFGAADNTAQNTARTYLDKYNSLSDNTVRGFIGALGGALIGAVPWAILLRMGYVAGYLGFLIAWISAKGYDVMKVKPNMKKFWSVAVSVIVAVFVGQVMAHILEIATDPELNQNFSAMMKFYIDNFGAFIEASGSNLAMGYVFALLGSLTVFADIKKENKARKEFESKAGGIY